MRMRYLNYMYYRGNDDDRYEVTLNHPKDLISLSLDKVKISNIN